MLGNESLPVDNLRLHVVAKLLFKRFPYDPECVAFVMIEEILDIFQEKSFGPFLFDDPCHVKE